MAESSCDVDLPVFAAMRDRRLKLASCRARDLETDLADAPATLPSASSEPRASASADAPFHLPSTLIVMDALPK